MALGGEPADPGIMNRPPRPPAESVLGAGLWQRILRVGLVVAAVTLPFLQELLHTQPLTGLDLAVVFLASTLGYAAVRLDRVLFRRKRPADPPGVASGGRP